MRVKLLVLDDVFKARLSEDRGEPLLRRLREHCEAVVFE